MSSGRQSIGLIVIDVLDDHKLETAEEKLYWWIYWLLAHFSLFLSTSQNQSNFSGPLSRMSVCSIESHL
jgi:hypothetical protein